MTSTIEYRTNSLDHAADILEHRLYSPKGVLRANAMKAMALGPKMRSEGEPWVYSTIYRVNGVPLGIAVIYADNAPLPMTPFKFNIMVFVKPSHRRIGVGVLLVTRLLKHAQIDKSQVYASPGVSGSKKFWQSLKIFCHDHNTSVSLTDKETAEIRAASPTRAALLAAKAFGRSIQAEMREQGFGRLIPT